MARIIDRKRIEITAVGVAANFSGYRFLHSVGYTCIGRYVPKGIAGKNRLYYVFQDENGTRYVFIEKNAVGLDSVLKISLFNGGLSRVLPL
jgi:hypothetical protein